MTDSYKGNTERPTLLGVNSIKDYSPKHARSGSGDSDDSSLPCTPELRESDGESCSAEYEELSVDTKALILQFCAQHSGIARSRWKEGKRLSTLKRVVDRLLERHQITYNGMFVLPSARSFVEHAPP